MNDAEFTFGDTAYEQALDALQPNTTVSAAWLLTLLEELDEIQAEEALESLEQRYIALEIGDLPKYAGGGAAAVRLRQEQQLVENGTLRQTLEETDPLRLYLEEISLLTEADGLEELIAAHLSGDAAATAQLADRMLPAVVKLAEETVGCGVLLLDLIQEGNLGLWQGILNYTDGDIQEHCAWWIRQYLAKAIFLQARANGVGSRLRQAMEDYRDIDQQLLTELGRNPTREEIAEALHISAEETEILEDMLRTARTVSRLKEEQMPKEPSQEDEQAVEDTAYFQSRQRIMELLSVLDPQDAQLLSLRFGLEGGLPLDPRQIGERLGLTPEEVVKREEAALKKLRADQ